MHPQSRWHCGGLSRSQCIMQDACFMQSAIISHDLEISLTSRPQTNSCQLKPTHACYAMQRYVQRRCSEPYWANKNFLVVVASDFPPCFFVFPSDVRRRVCINRTSAGRPAGRSVGGHKTSLAVDSSSPSSSSSSSSAPSEEFDLLTRAVPS